MAQAGQQRKGKVGADAPVRPVAGPAKPEDRAAYLDLIRALARGAARGDHARLQTVDAN